MWLDHTMSWWGQKDNPEGILFNYREMVRNFEPQLDRLLKFLGWSLTPEQRAKVIEKTNIKWMRAHPEKFEYFHSDGPRLFSNGTFIRKGGDNNRDEITPETRDLIWAECRKVYPKDLLAFLEIPESA